MSDITTHNATIGQESCRTVITVLSAVHTYFGSCQRSQGRKHVECFRIVPESVCTGLTHQYGCGAGNIWRSDMAAKVILVVCLVLAASRGGECQLGNLLGSLGDVVNSALSGASNTVNAAVNLATSVTANQGFNTGWWWASKPCIPTDHELYLTRSDQAVHSCVAIAFHELSCKTCCSRQHLPFLQVWLPWSDVAKNRLVVQSRSWHLHAAWVCIEEDDDDDASQV